MLFLAVDEPLEPLPEKLRSEDEDEPSRLRAAHLTPAYITRESELKKVTSSFVAGKIFSMGH